LLEVLAATLLRDQLQCPRTGYSLYKRGEDARFGGGVDGKREPENLEQVSQLFWRRRRIHHRPQSCVEIVMIAAHKCTQISPHCMEWPARQVPILRLVSSTTIATRHRVITEFVSSFKLRP
jgi:hypothetical protein